MRPLHLEISNPPEPATHLPPHPPTDPPNRSPFPSPRTSKLPNPSPTCSTFHHRFLSHRACFDMNYSNENFSHNMVGNGPTAATASAPSVVMMPRLSPNKPLLKPPHHSKLPPHRAQRRALGDITNKRNAPNSNNQLPSSSKQKSYLSHQQSNPFKIHMDPPKTSAPPSPSLRPLNANRIPKDVHGNVLSPESIPGAPPPAAFDEPCLFDSDDEVLALARNKTNSLKSSYNQKRKLKLRSNLDFPNSPVRKPKPMPFQSGPMPPIFNDFDSPPRTKPSRPTDNQNLFCGDSPELEFSY